MHHLEIVDLRVRRGDRTVLPSLSLAVQAGEVLYVQGRNGAGKTSLLEVVAGLRAPAAGRFAARPPQTQIHWVGHRNGLHPALTPLENLHFWCRLNGAASDAAGDALQRLGLHSLRHRPCGRLSMGQRRRAALARLLAAPRLWWLLDEPLAGLDAASIERVTALLAEHAGGGGGALVSSHQPFPGDIPGLRRLELA